MKYLLLVLMMISILPAGFAWTNCTPSIQCNEAEYYTDEGVTCPDPSNISQCFRTCSRTTGCYGTYTTLNDTYITDYAITNDHVTCSLSNVNFDDINDDCTGTSCYEDFCYWIRFKASGWAEDSGISYVDMTINVRNDEDITEFGPYYEFIDDTDTIDADGVDTMVEYAYADIYGYNYGSYSKSGNDYIGYFDATSGNEDFYFSVDTDQNVWHLDCMLEYRIKSSDYRTADTYYEYCERQNDVPVFTNCPNGFLLNNESGSSINIDLWDYHSDADGSDSDSTFTIESESNTSLIDCYISSDRYLTCNNPSPNTAGTSEISIQAEDLYENTATDTIYVTVWDPPEASNPFITPTNPTLGDNLICEFTYESPILELQEQDSIYEWYKNTVKQSQTTKQLGKGNLSANNQWTCAVIPSDGRVNGSKTAQSSSVTVLNTVEDIEFDVNGTDAYNISGYFSEEITYIEFGSQLQDELDSCIPDQDGYCNITLEFESQNQGTLGVSDLEIFYDIDLWNLSVQITELDSSGLTKWFGFIITNIGDYNITGINLTFDTGEDVIQGNQSFNLTVSDSIAGVFEYTYSESGSYNITMNAQTSNISAYDNLTTQTEDSKIIIQAYDTLTKTRLTNSVTFDILNNYTDDISGVQWNVSADGLNIGSQEFNISVNESVRVVFDHNYSAPGKYEIIFSATNTNWTDSKSMTLTINNVTVDELQVIEADGNYQLFTFTINNLIQSNTSNNQIVFCAEVGFYSPYFEIAGEEEIIALVEEDYVQTGNDWVHVGLGTDFEAIQITVGG